MEYVLETENLCVGFGKKKVLDNLNIRVPRGEIYGLVGKNGAGKTTLIRTVCGLIKPTSGNYSLFGVSSRNSMNGSVRRRLGAVAETPGFYPELSAYENMRIQYMLYGLPSEEGINELLKTMNLDGAGKEKVKNFSLGMKQRLGIAMALAGNPDFLILDEPANGLDPQGIVELRELLIELNSNRDITILVSSHILEELPRFATCYGFLKNGRIIKELSAEELNAQCREYMWMKVSDTKLLALALDGLGIEYSISSDTEALVYTDKGVGVIAEALKERGCELEKVDARNETLETFYLNLMGGDDNA